METTDINNILIRGTNWVGDAIMTTPALASVRKNFPRARISVLAAPWVAKVFEYNPCVDEVILYERKGRHSGLKGKIRLIGELRKRGFDLAILFQNAFEAAFIAWGARIPHRIGYNTDGRGLLLTHPVKMRPEYKKIHESLYYRTILSSLGFEAEESSLILNVPEDYSMKVKEALNKTDKKTEPLVVVAPGATYGSAKMWKTERYGKLMRILIRKKSARVIILGGPREEPLCAEIVRMAHSNGVTNLCGNTDLMEAAAWIKESDVFISNDSGLMHVAAALGRPQVAIFGPTNPITTGPKNPNARLLYHETSCAPCLKVRCPTDHRCMERITVDEVFDTACRLLEKE